MPRVLLSAAVLLAGALVFVSTVALPLATYTTALALFGLAHVMSELRYVDHRFGPRLGGGLPGQLAALLGVAVAARLAGMVGWLPVAVATGLELGAGALLVGVAAARARHRRWPGVALALGLALGAVLAPFGTLLAVAVTHNLTPLAFLAERLEGRRRRRVLTLLAIPFLGLPLLIATGLPYAALAAVGLVAPEASVFRAGDLAANLGAYVPAAAIYDSWALHAFSASVFAQCMHYVAVIVILPRLMDGDGAVGTAAGPLLRWPSAARFAWWLAVAAGALALGFALDYGVARRAYALAALVHAWVELPILLLALDAAAAPLQARRSA